MSSFGTGTTTTGGSSIVLTAFTGTNGAQAGTDGLVPGPAVNQAGYILGAGGDWTLNILGGIPLNESSDRIATTEFVQDVVGNAVLGGNAQLSQLTDVTIAGLADDQFLQYNVGSGKWENTTLTLSLISDVNLAGLVDGNALVYDANAGQWVPGQGGGGGAANLNDLGDVTIAGGAEFHFLVRNAQGQYVNRLITTADLSNSANIALLNQAQTFSGDVTFTADVDLIGATVDATTQPANDNSTLVATTEYADRQVSDSITALNLGTASQSNVGDFLASGSNLTDLGDVTVNGAVAEHFIVSDAQGNFTNRTISTSDLSDDANIALLNANQTFIGTVRATTQALDDDSTKLATTAYVTAQFSSDISTTSISDLADVHSLVGIQNGNVLAWVAGNNRFEFTAPAQTYTDEDARDAVGTALEGGAHTGISFSNNDNADTIEATVTLGGFSVGDLSDVDLAGVVNGKILKYNNGSFEVADETDTNTQLSDEQVQDIVGPMFTANNAGNTGITFSYDDTEGANDGTVTATVSIASTDLTDTANVARLNAVQTFSANNTFTADVDLTGANATASTQNASDNSTKLATTAYVDAQIDTDITALNLANTYQAKDASLDTITGIADGDLLLGNGADTFEKVSLQLGVENFLKSTARIAALSDVSLNGDELVNANHFLVSTGNGGFANQTISTSNLSDDASIALTTRATTFGAFAYNFEASTLTSATPALATDDTTVATTEWVNDVMNQAGNVSALDDLNDVLLANVANAQIIVYDSDGGANDNQWKNVSLSGDVSITNAGVATIANDAITTDKILNGQVSNAKLADSEITVGSTAISLGATSTTLSGMTGIDFTNADATIGGSMTTNLGNPTTLTLGGLGSKVIISGDLQVQGDTTTVNTATLDVEDTIIRLNKGVDGGANPNDIGLFFERGTTGNDAVFFFDESTDTFKLGTTTDAHTTTEFNDANLTLSPLRVESPAGGDNSTLVATTAWVLSELPEELNDLTDVTIANPVEGHFLVRNGAGVFVNRTVSSSDLSDTANIALLDANQTFTGTVSADTQALNDNSTKLATTAFVQNEINDLDLANTYQGLDDTLTALAGVNTVADKLIYASGVDTFLTTDLSAFGRSLIDDANSATARTTLGLEIGNNVQAYDDTLQSISALGTGADKLAYTTGVDTWAEATLSAFGRSLIDDADSATARTTLGLTSTATTALADLLQSANNLNDLGDEATARTNLGVAIGSDVQAYDDTLQALAGVNTVADRLIYASGIDTFSITVFTAFARTLLDDADSATARTTLGLEIDTDVQAYDDTLQSISALGTGADKLAYTTGVDTWAEADVTAFARTLLDDANSATARTTLGLEIDADVQAYDATLASISALGTGANKLAYTTGVDTWAEADLSAFARTLLDDADSATARATLGLTSTSTTALADLLQSANSLSEISDAGNEAVARGNLGLGSVSTLDTTVNGGNGENGKAVVTDGDGKLGALDGSNLTALGSIATHSDVDLTNIQNNQGLVYNANNSQFEPGSIPTSGTDVGQSPAITSQSISLNPNALVGGDLVIYGRVMEVIDYGSVADAFGAGDFDVDFGSVTDTVLYCADDYGVLVV